MTRATALLLLLLIAVSSTAAASPAKARILSGIGILLIRSEPAKPAPLRLFKELYLERITATEAALLPGLSPSLLPPEGFTPAIVTAKKSGWYRIVYDNGEREGWLEGRSSYQFYRWEELLKNRQLTLIGGLRKDYYLLRRDPVISSETLETVFKGSRITSLRAEGDWMKVITESNMQGWLRWRDDNSRLVIAINLDSAVESHLQSR